MGRIVRGWSARVRVAMAVALATGLGAVLVAPSASAASSVVSPLGARTYSLSSYYGPRCMPVANASTWHLGQDMGAASGTRINAVAAGTVLKAGAVSGFGQWVVVKHTIAGKPVSTVYGHVIDGDRYVRPGQKVAAGQRIADVGSTGTSTSPHLHLEVWNGTYGSGATHADPLPFLRARGIDLAQSATRVATRTTPSSCTYYANANVNLRAAASGSAAVLAVVPRSAKVVAKPGDGSGSWRRVTYGSRTGWVSAAYVGPNKPAAAAAPVSRPAATRYVTATSLNLRAQATTSSAVLARLARGTKLSVLSTSGGWLKVTTAGRTGWVSAQYTTTTAPAASAPKPAPPKAATSYVTASVLNLRAAPTTSSAVVAKLARGTAVKHAGTASKGWLKVTVGTRTGYVSTAYLSVTKPR
ncbi:SH3 domain-containing protein [Cellulosimicrobium sp. Marseille-Q8652]